MKNKALSMIKFFIGWPFSLIALFICRIILQKGQTILPNLKDINFQTLIYAVVCFVIYFFLRSLLWREILRQKGAYVSFKETAFLWGYSEIKRYIPGNIWGVLGRAVSFSDKKIDNKTIFSALIIEGVLVLLGTLLICLIFLPFIFENYFPALWKTDLILNTLRFLIFSLLMLFVFSGIIYQSFLAKKTFWLYQWLRLFLPNFSVVENLKLLLTSMVAFLLFGLGTYFSIASIFYLNSNHIFLFIGLFLFSFLIGYVSIITPTGLGVREAALIIGLSKFMSVANASIAAIFSRILVIVSEVIFLLLAYIWKNTRDKSFLKIEVYLRHHLQATFVVIAIVIYILLFTNFSFSRYENYYTGRFDLGNMDQTVWNTSQGRIFQLTNPDGTETMSRLAYHADFILVFLAPFYFYWSDPRMLLFLQTLILALGAVFVYKISLNVIKNKYLSLIFAIGYLLNPSLEYTNLYDFHAVTIATTALLGAFYFLRTKNYLLFLLCALIAALCKENVWLTVSFFGVYLILQSFYRTSKARRFTRENLFKILGGLSLFLFCLGVFYYLVWVAIPQARGSNHFALTYYSDFGTSPTQIVKNMVTNPVSVVTLLFQNGRLEYLKQIFLPLGLLPFLSLPTLGFVLPDFMINLLSNNSQFRQIYYQYTALITPFLFISAIFGLSFLKNRFSQIPNLAIGLFLLICFLATAYVYGPLPGAYHASADIIISPIPNKNEIDAVISKIKKRYSIAATNNLGSHLSRRKNIYTIPIGLEKADVIAFLLNDPFAQPSLKAQQEMVLKLKNNFNYKILYEKANFIVFQKTQVKR